MKEGEERVEEAEEVEKKKISSVHTKKREENGQS